MPLLVVDTGSAAGEDGRDGLLSHLRARWPGSFIIVLATGLPSDLQAATQVDWVQLPAVDGWPDASQIGSAWLGSLVDLYGCDAVIGLGVGSRSYLEAVEPTRAWLLLREGSERPVGFDGRVVEPGPGQLDRLDAELDRAAPIELTADERSEPAEVLSALSTHAAWERADRIRLYWRGAADPALLSLLRTLCDATGAAIELSLLTSRLFDLPRAGSTHAPAEFLLRAEAWRQALDLAGVVVRAPARVTINIRTQSRAAWIRSVVGLADRGVRFLRSALGALPGGRR